MERETKDHLLGNSEKAPGTDFTKLETDFESLREVLDQFIKGASHDLRGPLDQVQALVALLMRRHKASLNEDAQALCRHIEAAAERASKVFEGLQEYARFSLPVRFESVDSENVFKAAQYSCEVALRRAAAAVSNGPLPRVYGDSNKLMRVFEELLGNAVKFRGSEPPRIHVSCSEKAECFEFSVQDNGPGIPADKAKNVFEPFKRLHGYEYPGTGMGLAICKRIVEMHGGRIWVRPGPGGGSDFRFTLPLLEQPSK